MEIKTGHEIIEPYLEHGGLTATETKKRWLAVDDVEDLIIEETTGATKRRLLKKLEKALYDSFSKNNG